MALVAYQSATCRASLLEPQHLLDLLCSVARLAKVLCSRLQQVETLLRGGGGRKRELDDAKHLLRGVRGQRVPARLEQRLSGAGGLRERRHPRDERAVSRRRLARDDLRIARHRRFVRRQRRPTS